MDKKTKILITGGQGFIGKKFGGTGIKGGTVLADLSKNEIKGLKTTINLIIAKVNTSSGRWIFEPNLKGCKTKSI